MSVDFKQNVKKLLDEVLHLGGRGFVLEADSALLGAIPELDSMAVIALITAIEERFGCVVDDDEIDGAIFATLGSLTNFVSEKSSQRSA
ncbi:MAG: acyl carrier protein [Azonexaceae bacterium]|nr:acyl carrier protein [Azonexaceae bacterium]